MPDAFRSVMGDRRGSDREDEPLYESEIDGFVWRGLYASNIAYNKGDVVLIDDEPYLCQITGSAFPGSIDPRFTPLKDTPGWEHWLKAHPDYVRNPTIPGRFFAFPPTPTV